MKLSFLLALILLTTGSTVSAQQQEPVMTRSQFTPMPKVPPVKLSGKPSAGTPTARRLVQHRPSNKEWLQEGTLVDAAPLGKVYRMPVDNMVCLVPDATKTAAMPVKKTKLPEPMPNPLLGGGRGGFIMKPF